MNKQTFDIAIVGGGVIGTAVAYYAAKAGRSVVLLEKDHIAAGTSGACDGFIIMQSKNPGPHLELAMESAALYRGLADELDFDIEYQPKGGMIIIENDTQAALMQGHVAKQAVSGLAVDILDAAEARRREPALAPDLWGATYCAADAQVSPIRLAQGFSRAARRLGADIRPGTAVTGLIADRGQVCGVTTAAGDIYCQYVVAAAGIWTPGLVSPLGLDLPIKPRRGQILVTEPLPPTIRHVLLCACYLVAKYRPQDLDPAERHNRLGVGLAVEQTVDGGLLIGSTREFAGCDRATTLAGLEAVAAHARRLLPSLAGVNIIRTFAGLRPYTPDGLPIIGPAAGIPGLIIAAGHEGDGIALAPVTGRRVAAYLQ
jgi:sarcosine oxidase subunit beta